MQRREKEFVTNSTRYYLRGDQAPVQLYQPSITPPSLTRTTEKREHLRPSCPLRLQSMIARISNQPHMQRAGGSPHSTFSLTATCWHAWDRAPRTLGKTHEACMRLETFTGHSTPQHVQYVHRFGCAVHRIAVLDAQWDSVVPHLRLDERLLSFEMCEDDRFPDA